MNKPTRFIQEKPTKSLLALQRKLNAIFCYKRDNGENIEALYRHLTFVEKELSRRQVFY